MVQGAEHETLARLSARLDAQERQLAAQEEELVGLRTVLAGMEPGERSLPPVTGPSVPSATARVSAPVARRTRSASRRTLLKGAGAALFTTALLATGEVVPITPFRVAAATPATPTGAAPRAATTPDTLYQTFVGTDFQPETTSNGEVVVRLGPFNSAGAIYSTTIEGAAFSARLNLPQGATITEVIFYVINNSGAPMFVDIGAFDAADTSFVSLGFEPAFLISPSVQAITVPVLPIVVDNSQQSFVLEWFVGGGGSTDQQLYGARVAYTLPGSAQVYGSAQAGTGAYGLSASGIGLLGQSDAATGQGVRGLSDAGFPVVGKITGGANINAALLGLGTAGPGVQGQSTGGHGLVGTITTGDGAHAAVLGYVQPGANAFGVRGSIPAGATGLAGVFDGDVTVNGALRVYGSPKSAAVKHADGTYRLLYCEEAPESWFADYGEGTLSADKADITLDPDFASLVHTDTYHVFLTAHGPQHLHIAQRSATGFSVMATALGGGAGGPKPAVGGGTFSWRVVAKRKDIAGERLAKVAPPPALKAVQAFTVPEPPTAKPPTKKP